MPKDLYSSYTITNNVMVNYMITKKMKNYIEKHASQECSDSKSKIKHCVYMNRMQKRIDRELQMMLWLAIHYPQTFLDEEKEYRNSEGKIEQNRRLKSIILTIKALKPKMNVMLVLDNTEIPPELLK